MWIENEYERSLNIKMTEKGYGEEPATVDIILSGQTGFGSYTGLTNEQMARLPLVDFETRVSDYKTYLINNQVIPPNIVDLIDFTQSRKFSDEISVYLNSEFTGSTPSVWLTTSGVTVPETIYCAFFYDYFDDGLSESYEMRVAEITLSGGTTESSKINLLGGENPVTWERQDNNMYLPQFHIIGTPTKYYAYIDQAAYVYNA